MGWKSLFSGVASLVQGTEGVRRFEQSLARHLGRRHVLSFSSGKAALVAILRALHARNPQRDEVLIPAYTCYSVPSAIVRAGLRVRLCDLRPGTLDFDFTQLERQLDNPRLLCVMPTHLYGLPADVQRLRRLIRDPEITVVEDAAQAMGGEAQGQPLGTLGDVGFFSLGRGKAFSTVEGGLAVTDDDQLAATISARQGALPHYGGGGVAKLLGYALALNGLLHPRLFWLPRGLPFLKLGETLYDPDFPMRRLCAFQAGLARHWQERLESLQQIRRRHVTHWRQVLDNPLIPASVKESPPLIRYPLLLDRAESAAKLLRQSDRLGLGLGGAYPQAIGGIAALAGQLCDDSCPVAEDVARRLVTLPVHGYLLPADFDNISALLQQAGVPLRGSP